MRSLLRVRLFILVTLLAIWPNEGIAADQPIAVIVSPGYAKNLSVDELKLIYKRKKLFWNDGKKVLPVNLPASNQLRKSFSQLVLGNSPDELEKYWNDVYFHGISPPFVVGSEQAVIHFVAQTPGAIGYVSPCSLENDTEIAIVIDGDGHLTNDASSFACHK